MKTKNVDVLIIGGGASGYSTAIRLIQAGLSVALIDQTKDTIHKGELLTPKVIPLLKKLNCWEEFKSGNHQECPGIITSWGESEPYEADFIFNPYGTGWFINKQAMRTMFSSEFCSHGGEVFFTDQRIRPQHASTGSWIVEHQNMQIHASFLANAAGRSSLPSITSGKIALDKQVALIRVGKWKNEQQDLRLQVEASETGWGYLSFYPGGQVIQAFVTDSDLIPKDEPSQIMLLSNSYERTPLIAERIKDCEFESWLKVIPANTYLRKKVAGQDWLSVGDAAIALDPLSGLGVFNALKSGITAAEHIVDLKENRSRNLRDYSLHLMGEFERFASARETNYSKEQRWPESPFWARRISNINTLSHER